MEGTYSKLARYPLVVAAAGFLPGVVIARWHAIPSWVIFTGLCGVLGGAVVCLVRKKRRPMAVLGVLLTFILGLSVGTRAFHRNDLRDVGNFTYRGPVLVRARGVVSGRPSIRRWHVASRGPRKKTRFTLDLQALGATPVTGKIVVETPGDATFLCNGDRVAVVGTLKKPFTPSNPGGFDYAEYLRLRGVSRILATNTPENIRVLEKAGFPQRPLATARTRLAEWNLARLGEKSGARMNALLLGIREDLGEKERLKLVKTGTVHFFVVSGMHVAILALLVGKILGGLTRNEKIRSLSVVAFTLFFVLLVGFQAPAVRAGTMIVFYHLAFFVSRRRDAASALAAAAILIVFVEPWQIFSPGFHMSFFAVIFLIYFPPAVRRLLAREKTDIERAAPENKKIGIPIRYAGEALSAWLGTAPIVTNIGNIVSFSGIFLNVLLTPFIALALGIGFFQLVFSLLGADFLLKAAYPPLTLTLKIVETMIDAFASLEWLSCTVPAPPQWWIVSYYCAMLLLVSSGYLEIRRRFPAGLLAAVLLFIFPTGPRPDAQRLTLLSAPNGNACVLLSREGRPVLINPGSDDPETLGTDLIPRHVLNRAGRGAVDVVAFPTTLKNLNALVAADGMLTIGTIYCEAGAADSVAAADPSFAHRIVSFERTAAILTRDEFGLTAGENGLILDAAGFKIAWGVNASELDPDVSILSEDDARELQKKRPRPTKKIRAALLFHREQFLSERRLDAVNALCEELFVISRDGAIEVVIGKKGLRLSAQRSGRTVDISPKRR